MNVNTHRYTLEPYKGMNTRYHCPECGKRKTFTRYIDTQTGLHIAPTVGRCNREDNCSYHLTPKQYFQVHLVHSVHDVHTVNTVNKVTNREHKVISHIPFDAFKASVNHHTENNFIQYLLSIFDAAIVSKLIERYYIGTSKHWPGATVFWQIDGQGKIRAGKIMLYSPTTGKRVKEPYDHITWAHTALKLPEFNLQQCFFGEHLLKSEPTKPVAICESEKTAIIASTYLPKFIWLATGSKDGLNVEKCKALKGRQVILFPDLNGFEKWSNKAITMISSFKVSDLLERSATETERAQGLDLADYLTRFDFRTFTHSQTLTETPEEFAHILDLNQALNERDMRKEYVPGEVWDCFWKFKENPEDAVSLNKLIQFISLN